MVSNNKPSNKIKQQQQVQQNVATVTVAHKQTTTAAETTKVAEVTQQQLQQDLKQQNGLQKQNKNTNSNGNGNGNGNMNKKTNNNNTRGKDILTNNVATMTDTPAATTSNAQSKQRKQTAKAIQSKSINNAETNTKNKNTKQQQQPQPQPQPQQQNQKLVKNNAARNATNSYAQAAATLSNNSGNNNTNNNKARTSRTFTNTKHINNNSNNATIQTVSERMAPLINNNNKAAANDNNDTEIVDAAAGAPDLLPLTLSTKVSSKMSAGDILKAALAVPCTKCFKIAPAQGGDCNNLTAYEPILFTAKQYRKSKSYVGQTRSLTAYDGSNSSHSSSSSSGIATADTTNKSSHNAKSNYNGRHHQHNYRRSYSDRHSSFDRNFAERNKDFVPIIPPLKPILSSSNIAAVMVNSEKLIIIERFGKGRISYPTMQCGTLDAPDSSYHQQRSNRINRMDVYQIDDGFHSDGGTETPPPSPSSGSSIASTSDHGSLESVDTGGTQRLAVLSFEQVSKLHHVMDEKVAIHGRGNFPTLEVTLKDLVNSVRRKLEADVNSGGAGVIVKDIRLNGGAASHVLASEDQPYNDLDLIYAIELSSSRHFDRVKTAVLNTLLDLLPEGVSKRRIMPCALKEAYVGKMVKVNNNNDGDRWSLISLGNSPGHKNVELKFVDTMRRQFEFSVDSFQIVLDSLLLFYDCVALPITENFYPTVVGESVYGDFQEALYHLQKKLISTRQPEEIRGGGLLKYCNLLVRNYKPVDPQRIKTLERYMCSRFFIDFPDINTQTVKLEAYLRNHFWGVDEEPMQYQYLMHLHEVVETSTVCLMGHERRQTLQLIQTLAAQVLYKEQQKHQHAHAHEHYHQHQQHHQHHHHQHQQQQLVDSQQQQQTQQSQQTQPQTIYVQQAQPQSLAVSTTATICCTVPSAEQQAQAQQQAQQQQNAAATVPQTIQIQAGPPGLIYANGVYYAPVIPTAICTCNSTWLST